MDRVLQCTQLLLYCASFWLKLIVISTLYSFSICDQNKCFSECKAKSPPPPLTGIDQLTPPPRPLGLRSADAIVKDVNVDDLDLGGGEVRVKVFSVEEEVEGGRRLLPTPLSVDLSVDLINIFKWEF